jgi:hypothetical protein
MIAKSSVLFGLYLFFQASHPSALQITLSTSSDVIRSGSSTVVTVSRKNITDHVIQYQRPKHPLGYTNFAATCQGKPVEERIWLRQLRDRAKPSPSAASVESDIEMTLGPGQVTEENVDLNDYYLFPPSSKCSVSIIEGSAFHPEDAPAHHVISNSISFTTE